MFPRDFATPQQGKSKETFENRGQKGSISGASVAAFLGGLWGFLGAIIRLFGSAGGLPLSYSTNMAK